MAKKIRFSLEMENGTEVRELDELKDNFSLERVLYYIDNGKLFTWLRDRYYDDIAGQIQELDKDDPDYNKKLCEIFEVAYDESAAEDIEKAEQRARKLALLKELTDDSSYASKIDSMAFDQDDLYDLLDEGMTEVYLCGERFSVPLGKKGISYIGVNDPTVVISSKTLLDFSEKSITFTGVRFDEKYQALVDASEKKERPSKNPEHEMTSYTEVCEKCADIMATLVAKESWSAYLDMGEYYIAYYETDNVFLKVFKADGKVYKFKIDDLKLEIGSFKLFKMDDSKLLIQSEDSKRNVWVYIIDCAAGKAEQEIIIYKKDAYEYLSPEMLAYNSEKIYYNLKTSGIISHPEDQFIEYDIKTKSKKIVQRDGELIRPESAFLIGTKLFINQYKDCKYNFVIFDYSTNEFVDVCTLKKNASYFLNCGYHHLWEINIAVIDDKIFQFENENEDIYIMKFNYNKQEPVEVDTIPANNRKGITIIDGYLYFIEQSYNAPISRYNLLTGQTEEIVSRSSAVHSYLHKEGIFKKVTRYSSSGKHFGVFGNWCFYKAGDSDKIMKLCINEKTEKQHNIVSIKALTEQAEEMN